MAARTLLPLQDAAGAFLGRTQTSASQPVAASVRHGGHPSSSRLHAEVSIVGKTSSERHNRTRRGFLSRAASGDGETAVDVAVQEAAKQEPLLPDSSHGVISGEWGHNFSIQTYEDLHQHFTVAAEREAARIAETPLLPDKSHGVLSGEWGHNFSIQTYEDLHEHFADNVFKKGAEPDTIIADIMVRQVRAVAPSDPVASVLHHLESVTGVPVVDAELKCVGLLSKRDIDKGKDLSGVLVRDVMSSPAITLTPGKTVKDAVIEMLKNKIHRVPVVNDEGQLVGIVTRTDIFTALESPEEGA